VARRQAELDSLAGQLKIEHGVKVHTIALDLSTLGSGQQLVDQVAGLNLEPEILINNAGFGTNNRLAEEDRGRIQQEVVLNVATLVDLTAA
jgi:short-subunit dehydrogenase